MLQFLGEIVKNLHLAQKSAGRKVVCTVRVTLHSFSHRKFYECKTVTKNSIKLLNKSHQYLSRINNGYKNHFFWKKVKSLN